MVLKFKQSLSVWRNANRAYIEGICLLTFILGNGTSLTEEITVCAPMGLELVS